MNAAEPTSAIPRETRHALSARIAQIEFAIGMARKFCANARRVLETVSEHEYGFLQNLASDGALALEHAKQAALHRGALLLYVKTATSLSAQFVDLVRQTVVWARENAVPEEEAKSLGSYAAKNSEELEAFILCANDLLARSEHVYDQPHIN